MEQLWLFPECKPIAPVAEKIVKQPVPKPRMTKKSSFWGISKYAACAVAAAMTLQSTSLETNEQNKGKQTQDLEQVIVDSNMPALPNLPVASPYDFLKQKGEGYVSGLGDEKQDYLLLVDKDSQTAALYMLSLEKVDETKISTGLAVGNKIKEGDMKTPNGIFQIVDQEYSAGWVHNGQSGAYGKYFSRLNAGSWNSKGTYFPSMTSSIAIHGTNQPEKIGSRASEGCIRLPNEKNEEYVTNRILKKGTIVAVVGDSYER